MYLLYFDKIVTDSLVLPYENEKENSSRFNEKNPGYLFFYFFRTRFKSGFR